MPRLQAATSDQELGVLKEGAAGDVIIVDYDPLTPMNENNINGHLVFGVTGHECGDNCGKRQGSDERQEN